MHTLSQTITKQSGALKRSQALQVSLQVAGVPIPGSPLAVTVAANTPCPRTSIPSTFVAPFVACAPLAAPTGTAFAIDVPLRDCWGNFAALSESQVRPAPLHRVGVPPVQLMYARARV